MLLILALSLVFLQTLTPEVIEHAQAGDAALKEHRLDDAVREFQKVVELQPKSASGYANLGDAYFEKGDFGKAIPELRHALELNPKLMATHQALGVALLVQGDADGAIPHLEQTRNPALAGLALLEAGRLGSAIVALDAALKQQPGDPDLLYYFGRANMLAAQQTAMTLRKIGPAKQRDAAPDARDVAALEAAVAADPLNPALLTAFEGAAENTSKQAFDAVLQRAPGSARAYQIAAERDAAAQRWGDAEKEFEQALQLRPYTSGVHIALGNVLLSEGKWSPALVEFAAEATLRPASADVAYRHGVVLLEFGRTGMALDELARADRLKPNNPEILAAIAKAALAAHDPARAESELLALLSIEKQGDMAAAAHEQLAKIYRAQGKTAEAAAQQAAYDHLKQNSGGSTK